jgi:AmmeMemoRadiSam system protein A
MLNAQQKKYLADIARRAIDNYFENEDEQAVVRGIPAPEDAALVKNGASFVTLTVHGRLRGCIGSVEAYQPLYKDVAANAVSAAFFDPRFDPLSQEELGDVAVEISVLTEPKPLLYAGEEDLLKKLRSGVDGIILGRGAQRATFLPQVWEELPKKEQFLGHLCRKAGFSEECWKEGNLDILTYQVDAFD